MKTGFLVTSATALLMLSPAVGQDQEMTEQQQRQQSPAVAKQCLEELRAFEERVEDEAYWFAGWTGAGVPGTTDVRPSTGPVTAPERRARPNPGTRSYGISPRSSAEPPVIGPRHEMTALFRAAEVLAYRGDEQACKTLTAALTRIFDQHIQEMRAQGLEPGEIRDWRQAQLLAAEPVEKLPDAFHSDAIIGSDLRNLEDENLGSIEDVLVDPETGEIAYVLVSRGGFLGLGEEHYAVPWDKLRAAPTAGTFVLDVPESAVEQAPSIERERLASREGFKAERGRIDHYWNAQQSQ